MSAELEMLNEENGRLRRAVETYKAALAKAEADARQWQPIETAPRDFVTVIDGWNGERVVNMTWAHPSYYSKKDHYAWCEQEYDSSYGWESVEVKGLTHWMPLPAAPGTEPVTNNDAADARRWRFVTGLGGEDWAVCKWNSKVYEDNWEPINDYAEIDAALKQGETK